MKNSYLFPSCFKKIGWIMFLLFLVFSIFSFYLEKIDGWYIHVFALVDGDHYFTWGREDISNEFTFLGITLSLLFISFAREKEEDEYISRMRCESLVWAVIVNYIILIIATWLIYGIPYLQVMMYNMFTMLFLFIFKFHLALYKLKKSMSNEK